MWWTAPCVKCTLCNSVKLFQCRSSHCVFPIAGMAELHPEECRSRLHRVGQRRQVGNSDMLNAVLSAEPLLPSSLSIQPTSTHQPLSNVTIPGSHHSPSAPKDPQSLTDRVAVQDSGQQSMIGVGAGEDGRSLSSRLHTMHAHPRGIREKETG